MRLRVDDSALLPGLLLFLDARVDLVTLRRGDTEADVSVLGSFADGGRAELDSHLDNWRRVNPTASVELAPPPPERDPIDDWSSFTASDPLGSVRRALRRPTRRGGGTPSASRPL